MDTRKELVRHAAPSPAKKPSPRLPTELCSNAYAEAAAKTGLSSDTVRDIADGHSEQIRRMTVPPEPHISILLSQVAQQYGATTAIAPHILEECTALVVDRFSHLGVHEIRTAYRLWAASEITPAGAEMYYGEFNAAQLGKVLSAYCEHRKGALSIYLREMEKHREAAEEQACAEKKRARFEENFPRRIEEARAGAVTDWRQVPAYWYEAAKNRGMFTISREEALQIWEEAKEMARMDLETEIEEEVNIFKRNSLEAILGKAGDMESRAKVIAHKIVVFRKLILQAK